MRMVTAATVYFFNPKANHTLPCKIFVEGQTSDTTCASVRANTTQEDDGRVAILTHSGMIPYQDTDSCLTSTPFILVCPLRPGHKCMEIGAMPHPRYDAPNKMAETETTHVGRRR